MTVKNINNLTIEQLSNLSDEDLLNLGPEQIAQLSDKEVFRENIWAERFLGRLNVLQIRALNPSIFSTFIWGFEYLSEYFFSNLTRQQLECVDERMVGYWGAKQLSTFSADQIDALGVSKLALMIQNKPNLFDQNWWAWHFLSRLTTKAQVEAINPGQLSVFIWGFEYCPDSFYADLNASQVAAIDPENLKYWDQRQLRILSTSQEQCSALSSSQIEALIGSKSNLFEQNDWATAFLTKLSREQIQTINPTQFSVFIWGFESYQDSFYRDLKASQVAAIHSENLKYWGQKQLNALSVEGFQALTDSQIQVLQPDAIRLLSIPTISLLTINQLKAILNKPELATVLTKVGESGSWAVDKFQQLSGWAVDVLYLAQNSLLTSQQVSSLSKDQIHALTPVQIAQISNKQLGLFWNNDWASAFLGSLNYLQIQAIDPKQFTATINGLEKLSSEFYGSLYHAQVAELGSYNLDRFGVNQINALSAAAFPELRVGLLKKGILKDLSADKIALLTIDQVKAILNKPDLATVLTNIGTVDSWSAEQIASLSIHTINQLGDLIQKFNAKALANMAFDRVDGSVSGNVFTQYSSAQIAELAKEQIDKLTVSQLQGILHNEELAKVVVSIGGTGSWTLGKFQSLSSGAITNIYEAQGNRLMGSQLMALSTSQIGALSTAQISVMTTNLPSIFFNNDQAAVFLNELNEGQTKAIALGSLACEINSFEKIREGFFQNLTKEQVAAIGGVNLAKITSGQLNALSVEGFQSLSGGQLEWLSTATIKSASVEKINYWLATKPTAKLIGSLSKNQIKELEFGQVKAMLNNPELAKVITNIGGNGSWDAGQISGLPTWIINLLSEDIRRFNSKAISSMVFNDVSTGTQVSGEQLATLTASQICALSNAQITLLNENQLKAILNIPGLAAVIVNRGSLEAWSDEQFASLSSGVVGLFASGEKAKWLLAREKPEITSIRYEDFKKYLDDLGVRSVITNVGAVGSWSKEQIASLSGDLINKLGIDIQKFNSEAIANMVLSSSNGVRVNGDQLAKISSSQLNALTTQQIINFDFYQIQGILSSPELVKVVSNIGVLGSWSVMKFQALGLWVVDRLYELQGDKLMPSQFAALSANQLSGLSKNQIKELTIAQVKAILNKPELATVLTKVGESGSWNAGQISSLSIGIINLLGEDIQKFNAKAISNMVFNDASNGAQVSGEQLSKLSERQIAELSSDQIANLSTAQLSKLNAVQINALLEEQIRSLSGEQILAILGGGQARVVISSIGAAGSWTVSKLRAISGMAINAVGKSVPNYFETAVINQMTTEQMQSISLEAVPNLVVMSLGGVGLNVARLTPAMLCALTNSQLLSLTIGQLNSILNNPSISDVARNISKINCWTKDQFQHIAIRELNPQQVLSLTKYQIAAMSANQFIGLLYLGKRDKMALIWDIIKNVGSYGSWTDEQMAALPAEVINILYVNIRLLDNRAISHMNFKGVSGEQISQLTPDQLNSFSNAKISALDQYQIECLMGLKELKDVIVNAGSDGCWSIEKFQCMNPEAIASWARNNPRAFEENDWTNVFLSKLNALQIQSLPDLVFKNFIFSFERLPDSFFRSLAPAQVKAIDNKNLYYWRARQVNALSGDAILALEVSQINILHRDVISGLSNEKIRKLSNVQVNAILENSRLSQVIVGVGSPGSWTGSQFSSLSNEVIKDLSRWTIQKIDSNVAWQSLNQNQIRSLSAEQINAISIYGMGTLLEVGRYDAWSRDQLLSMSKEAFFGLTNASLSHIHTSYLQQLIQANLGQISQGESISISPALFSYFSEQDLIKIFNAVGVKNLSALQISFISVDVLKNAQDINFISAIQNLNIGQIKFLSNEQIDEIKNNERFQGGGNAVNQMLDYQQRPVIADSLSATNNLAEILDVDTTSLVINTRNLYVFTTLLRAVWGSQSIFTQAKINQHLAQYEANLLRNNANSTGRHNYQALRGFGSVMSWSTAASYMYQASLSGSGSGQAINAMQGISYFLGSLKPLSALLSFIAKVDNPLDMFFGKKLVIVKLGQAINDGYMAREVISSDDLAWLVGDNKSYVVYQTAGDDGVGKVTHLYIQEAFTGIDGQLTTRSQDLRNRAMQHLGIKKTPPAAASGESFDSRFVPTQTGADIYKKNAVGSRRFEGIKKLREMVGVQIAADGFAMGFNAYALSQLKFDGSEEDTKSAILNTLGMTSAFMTLVSDFGGPTMYGAKSAKYLKLSSNLFAASNILTDIASLTIAAMDVANVAQNSNASEGQKYGAYGTFASVAFLSVLTGIAVVAPQFALPVFVAALLMPNFQSIGLAMDIDVLIHKLRDQDQAVYANEILVPLYDDAVVNSIPIIGFFNSLDDHKTLKKIEVNMRANGKALLWEAIGQMQKYSQVKSDAGKLLIEQLRDAIKGTEQISNAVLITAMISQDQDFYVNDEYELNYATMITIHREKAQGADKFDLFRASEQGVRPGEKDVGINIKFGANDTRSSINAIVGGNEGTEIVIDVSEFKSDGNNAFTYKDNQFEIRKNNVTVYANERSMFRLDLGAISNLSSIHIEGYGGNGFNSIILEDVMGGLSSLSIDLDLFTTRSGFNPIINGLLGYSFPTTNVVGSRYGQIYNYGGGIDNIKMLGGHGTVKIGGAGSRLKMAKGGNVAYVEFGLVDNPRIMGEYDGGESDSLKEIVNRIDFSQSIDDNLIFLQKNESINGVNAAFTEVYGFLKSSKDGVQFAADALGYIETGPASKNLNISQAADSGRFNNFNLLSTGQVNNYLQISGNTDLQGISLDGKERNILNLGVTSIKNRTVGEGMLVESSVTGLTEIYLNNYSLDSCAIVGRGGSLKVAAHHYGGDLLLDLTNSGGLATSFSNSWGNEAGFVKALIRDNVDANVGRKFEFEFGLASSAYVEIEKSATSEVLISDLSRMADDAGVTINSSYGFDELEFSTEGNSLLVSSLYSHRNFLTLSYGTFDNGDNIFFANGDGIETTPSEVVGLDALIQAMATVRNSGVYAASYRAGGHSYYSGKELLQTLSASKV